MALYSISNLLVFVAPMLEGVIINASVDMIMNVCSIVCLICSLALSFVKDLGKSKSLGFAYAILFANVIKLVINVCMNTLIFAGFVNLVLAVIVFIFINVKYIDKELRGDK